MTKAEQLEYMRKNWTERNIDHTTDAIIPTSNLDILDEIDKMESFEEYKRNTTTKILTSDEL